MQIYICLFFFFLLTMEGYKSLFSSRQEMDRWVDESAVELLPSDCVHRPLFPFFFGIPSIHSATNNFAGTEIQHIHTHSLSCTCAPRSLSRSCRLMDVSGSACKRSFRCRSRLQNGARRKTSGLLLVMLQVRGRVEDASESHDKTRSRFRACE